MAKRIDPPLVAFRDYSADEAETLRAEGTKAKKITARMLTVLRASLGKLDQIEILARLAFQFIVPLHKFGTAEFDPTLHSHELELLQALALSHPRSVHFDQREMNDTIDALLHLVRAHSKAEMQRSLRQLSPDPKQNRTEAILHRMRATTHTVRGPRHAYQTRFYVRDLAAELDGRFMAVLGVSVTDIVDVLDVFAIQTGEKLAALQNRARAWMAPGKGRRLDRFLAANPGQTEHPLVRTLSADMPDEWVMATLLAVFEEELCSIFRLDQLDTHPRGAGLREHLGRLALGFGDVTADMLAHLQLGNPVRSRPIVDAGDGALYLFCTQTAFSNLVELIDDLAAADPTLKNSCETFKARWLETKLETLVRGGFPGGKVLANAKWKDADGRDGETDAILLIDKTAVFFEAKSGRITPPARRGAAERLKREIDTLLVEPSRQSARLAALVRTSEQPVRVAFRNGSDTIDGGATREIIRVNILFDTLGPLTAGTKRLVEAGFIGASEPMAPSMSIFELETLLDILPSQISRLHYLRRRSEIEQAMLFEADEMDLIAFYLENSFCLKALEQDEGGFGIYGWSDRIAAHYDHEGNRTGSAPSLRQTPFWRDMLAAIEGRGDPGWTRFGYRLSNVAYRDQWAVQRTFDGMMKRARRIRRGQAVNSGVHDAGGSNRTVVGLCVGKDVSAFGMEQHSQTAAVQIMDRAGADEAIVLYWDVSDRPAGLRFVATYLR